MRLVRVALSRVQGHDAHTRGMSGSKHRASSSICLCLCVGEWHCWECVDSPEHWLTELHPQGWFAYPVASGVITVASLVVWDMWRRNSPGDVLESGRLVLCRRN